MGRTSKYIDVQSRLLLPRAGAGGTEKVGSDCAWVQGFFGGDENVLKLDHIEGAQLWEDTENHEAAHVKLVPSMLTKLHFTTVVLKRTYIILKLNQCTKVNLQEQRK